MLDEIDQPDHTISFSSLICSSSMPPPLLGTAKSLSSLTTWAQRCHPLHFPQPPKTLCELI
jgi:hypothetical protein